MIKLFILMLIAASIGMGLALQLLPDPGYVLIAFADYTVETTLLVAITSLLGIIIVLKYSLALIKQVNPVRLFNVNYWFTQARTKRAQHRTLQGMLRLAEGDWQQAHRLLMQSADQSDSAVINYLAASLAAFQMKDKELWARNLQQVEKKYPSAAQAVNILKVKMQLRSGQLEQSLAMLLKLRENNPQNSYVLELLKEVYVRLQDWTHLHEIMPDLEKHKILSPDELLDLECKIFLSQLSRIAGHGSNQDSVLPSKKQKLSVMHKIWKNAPAKLRNSEEVITAYVSLLLKVSAEQEAMQQVATFLQRQWSDELVRLFGLIETRNKSKSNNQQLLQAEGWLKARPNNAVLLLTLGRLCMRSELWAKAKEYYQASLKISPNAEVNAELGRLLAHLNEHEKSTEYFRQGIQLLEKSLPKLPMPS